MAFPSEFAHTVLAPATRVRVASTAFVLILLATTARAEPWFLAPFVAFDTGREPWAIAAADFDVDGRMDLVTANSSGSVSILLGKGDGTFPFHTDYGAGLVPMGLSVADFNGDGRADVVVANRDAATVSVLIGNGDGTFRSKIDTPLVIEKPTEIATADLNVDGWSDLVVLHPAVNLMTVWRGNGDGTFSNRIDYPARDQAEDVTMADLNADGWPDLVVAHFGRPVPFNESTRVISVRLGLGNGAFSSSTSLRTSGHPQGVKIADMNDDGRPDLVASSELPSLVEIFFGSGDGSFTAPIVAGSGPNSGPLAVADLDADGQLDVAAVNWGASKLTVLRGTSNGVLGPPELYITGHGATSVAIVDVNGDGRQDLVSSDGIASSISVLLAKEDGTLPQGLEFETGTEPVSVAFADLDSDGHADLVAANVESDYEPVGTLSVLMGIGGGAFGAKHDLNLGVIPVAVQIADLNGDLRPDLAVAGATGRPDDDFPCGLAGSVRLWIGNGDGTFTSAGGLVVGCDPTAMTIADLNADGSQDIAVSSSNGAVVSVLLGNGDGTFRTRTELGSTTGSFGICVGDFNGDGLSDLLASGVFLGRGDGSFGPALPLPTLPIQSWMTPRGLGVGDMNLDGRLDVAAAAGEEVWVFLGDGSGSFAIGSHMRIGRTPFAVAVVDLDADGRPDLAVTNHEAYSVSVLRGRGDGTFEPKADFGVGALPRSLAVTDVDGDGRLDLGTANSYSNTVSILLNRGPSPPPAAAIFELTPRTLNLSSRGRWVTAVLEPALGAAASDVDVSSVRLNESVPVDPSARATVGDHNGNGIPDLKLRFDRVALELTLADGEDVPVTVTGVVAGKTFLGTAFLRVRRAAVTVAGSRLPVGSSARVSWEVPSGTGNRQVELRYSLDAGGSWHVIPGPLPNTGSCQWTLPDTPAEEAKVALVLVGADGRGESTPQVLGVSGGFSIESTLAVDPPTALSLSLRGARPNPAPAGRFAVEFSLSDGSPARLELVDVAGRLRESHDVGALGPGSHLIELVPRTVLSPGIYFLRLRQNGRELLARAAVVR